MNTKEKSKRGKAIIGIALAAVMLASVFVAMVPTVSADDGAIPNDSVTIFRGTEHVNISALGPGLAGTIHLTGVSGDAEDKHITITNVSDFEVLDSWATGGYTVDENTSLSVTIEKPTIETKIKLEDGTDVTNGAIVEDQEFYIEVTTNFGNVLGNDPNSTTIKLDVINPDNVPITADAYGVPFTRSDVTADKVRFPNATGFYKLEDAGPYEITAKTPSPGLSNNSYLEISATEVTLDIVTEEVSIDVEETEVAEGEDVIVTGTGKAKTYYNLTIDPGGGVFKPDVKDVEVNYTGKGNNTARVKTDSKGKYKAIIDTEKVNTGSYTVYIEKDTDKEDKVEYKIVELKVTLETDKTTYVIGEDVTISGTSPTGKYMIIAIDEEVVKSERIKADDTYEYKWTRTEEKIPGSYKIEVWNYPITWDVLHPKYAEITKSADATTTIYLSEPDLKAGVSRTSVALGDEFWVEGEAAGADMVNIIVVSPKGTGGAVIDTGEKTDLPSIYARTTSVSATDYTFEHKVSVSDDADSGKYLVIVLCPGKDRQYNGLPADTDVSNFVDKLTEQYGLDASSKSQDAFLSVIEDATISAAGTDDLIWVGYVKAEEGRVTLDAIADVGAGEPLVVSGTTNRKDGHPIVITVKGPMEIPAKTAYVENGTFNATFDTSEATPGTYTVMADDGDGHTDEATVNIGVAAPTPTPTPVVSPTPTPTEVTPTPTMPVATPTPTPPVETPTPTPKPPGFEAVFAIAGLLAVAYLVLRKRR